MADYILTVVGAKISERNYRQHFKISSYELNPIFQKHIAQKRWFSAKHTAGVLIITAICWYFFSNWEEMREESEFTFGLLTGSFITIIGAHLSNLITFAYLNKNPTEVSGEVKIDHCYTLNTAGSRYVIGLLPTTLIGIVAGSPFVYGVISALALLICMHVIWYVKARKIKSNPA